MNDDDKIRLLQKVHLHVPECINMAFCTAMTQKLQVLSVTTSPKQSVLNAVDELKAYKRRKRLEILLPLLPCCYCLYLLLLIAKMIVWK